MITLDQGGRAASGVVRKPVPRELEHAVEAIWLVPRQRAPQNGWRVVADPNPHVIVHRTRDGRTRASVVGARSRYVDVDQGDRSFTVGVRLAVGALGLLTSVSAEELTDRSAGLGDLFDAQGEAVTRELEDAEGPCGALTALTDFLRRRVDPVGRPDWRVRGLMATLAEAPGTPIGAAADRLGVAGRTLRETMLRQVGFAPKTVQRVHRLLRGLSTMRRDRGLGGARAAAAVGYVDQAHFVHECRALLGEPPLRFLARGDADSYKGKPGPTD